MYQSFDASTTPEQGPARLERLRRTIDAKGLSGFLVSRADKYQGEYVAPCDERLAWLTGFTGSFGFCVVLPDIAGVFIDGRYRVQVKEQVSLDVFTPVPFPETKPGPWIADHLATGKIGFDPWLHTPFQIDAIREAIGGSDIELVPYEGLIDQIWTDRPASPSGKAVNHPVELAGKTSQQKRADIAAKMDTKAAVITLPDSICWLLNMRGTDIARNPIVQCFAILHDSGKVDLFANPDKFSDLTFDAGVQIHAEDAFEMVLTGLGGPVALDRESVPVRVVSLLEQAGTMITFSGDPCVLPKACKNDTEIEGARAAHLRDAHAMVNFLAWLDLQKPNNFSEIDVVKALEGFRRDTNALKDISFETISGAGPNGAIVHYRVTEGSNRIVANGELLLVDSGGQYVDGTTDITRTIAIGRDPSAEQKRCFTLVLQGMIAVSMARFPRGLSGRDIDPLARAPLWRAGLDYDHGTGHGVGSYLSVHEGPQRISRVSDVKLQPGMILSNEPGYYREDAFGIRIENLIVVRDAKPLGDKRDQLDFETLTWVPIDRHLIDTELLSPEERAWVDAYHAEIAAKLRVTGIAETWLKAATAPL